MLCFPSLGFKVTFCFLCKDEAACEILKATAVPVPKTRPLPSLF